MIPLPPAMRSPAASGLTRAAALGAFRLQHCAACGAVQYPPRDACHRCLSTDLAWRDTDPRGTVLAETALHATADLYFRARTPWRMGSVRLDLGVSVFAHLTAAVGRGDRVRLALRLDRAGQGVAVALPGKEPATMADDPLLRELSSSPRGRHVVIAAGAQPGAPALVQACRAAGAVRVWAGTTEADPSRVRDTLRAAGADLLPLDVTDGTSVAAAVHALQGQVDILVANQRAPGAGGILSQADAAAAAQRAMEVNALGLMRLGQGFGPALIDRAGMPQPGAPALVVLLSTQSVAPEPGYAGFAASQAAALSLAESLRADLRRGGIRVVTAFTGPTDDDVNAMIPPPKLSPAAIARGVVSALDSGLEEVWIGDIAREIAARRAADAQAKASPQGPPPSPTE